MNTHSRLAQTPFHSYVPPTNKDQTLTAFLSAVLSKKYTNPSSDVIEVLAGLDKVDKLITELVSGLERLIRAGSTCQLPGAPLPKSTHADNAQQSFEERRLLPPCP